MVHLKVFCAILISAFFIASALKLKCDGPKKPPRFPLKAQQHECSCLPKRAGQLKYENGELLVCTGSEWEALQYKLPEGSISNPGYSCKDIKDNNPSQTQNGVYWIALEGKMIS